MIDTIFFGICAFVAVISAILVVTRLNPLMSALWLVICFAATAALFALLSAPFLAVLQILVYAGAIMVLFIFVIMLIDLGPEGLKRRAIHSPKIFAGFASGYLAWVIVLAVWHPPFFGAPEVPASFGDAKQLGEMLLTTYAVPFEIASLLLLGAVVGAVVMGKKQL